LFFLSSAHQQVFFDFTLDSRVLLFTAASATLTGLLVGVAPAFRGTATSLTTAIKASHATAGGPRTQFRLWIVASQVALSLALLVTAGLLLRTIRNLATTDIGFDANHVLLVNVNLFDAKIPQSDYTATYERLEAELRSLPGVVSVARSLMTPLGDAAWNTQVISDTPHPAVGDYDNLVYFNFVDPAYFTTLRTPLLAGRDIIAADSVNSAPVAVINQTVARGFFPGVNPVGHTFRPLGAARKPEPPVEVVGVVKDAKYYSVREETFPTIFRPIAQLPGSSRNSSTIQSLSFEVRAHSRHPPC
jgi:putative ABC transport system permease protein